MNKTFYLLLTAIFFTVDIVQAQTCQDATVELTAEVQAAPPRITLHWTPNAGEAQHFIYRKLKSATSWGSALNTLTGSDTTFTDTTVMAGISYEYRVTRLAPDYNGYGYINAGIEIPAVEQRGTIIVVIDSTVVDSLSNEISVLLDDLRGDGWYVTRLVVSREANVKDVKALIVSAYNQASAGPKSVFLLGHVPVPYSGELNPDAHPDHLGAWPADVYYADVNGSWTDAIVNNSVADDPRNRNVTGDGKFDQSVLPTDAEMATGRVDFANMPAFTQSEIALLRNYLTKNHAYRHKQFTPLHRMLIDDNFGFFDTEAFAANAWKNTPVVGRSNVRGGDYFPDLTDSSYLWSYGCGGGWFSGAGGVGSTTDFSNTQVQTVFTMLFGSYFGDWDSQNNFLRAALASGTTLTNVWAGRPHWMFHHMGLGETIGYSTRISQNNQSLYFSSFGARGVHMALMGDPTLRNDVVAPVSEVVAKMEDFNAHISWKASSDDVLGYHLYMAKDESGSFIRVNSDVITETSYIDSCLLDPGVYTYMVRALILQQSPSGSYYNMSQGMIDTVYNGNDLNIEAGATWSAFAGVVTFENTSLNGTSFEWIFGDGETSDLANPAHTFVDGDYIVTLIASNACDADTFIIELPIVTTTTDTDKEGVLSVYPNPSAGKFKFSSEDAVQIKVYDILGELIVTRSLKQNENEIDLSGHPNGIYLLVISRNQSQQTQRLILKK